MDKIKNPGRRALAFQMRDSWRMLTVTPEKKDHAPGGGVQGRKHAHWGPNAWRPQDILAVPYPPTAELDEQLAKIRRQQRSAKRRIRQALAGKRTNPGNLGVLGLKTFGGAEWGDYSGTTLMRRANARKELRAARRMLRRVQRHGGVFSKASRELLALTSSTRFGGAK